MTFDDFIEGNGKAGARTEGKLRTEGAEVRGSKPS
jgi:hypothetical protein